MLLLIVHCWKLHALDSCMGLSCTVYRFCYGLIMELKQHKPKQGHPRHEADYSGCFKWNLLPSKCKYLTSPFQAQTILQTSFTSALMRTFVFFCSKWSLLLFILLYESLHDHFFISRSYAALDYSTGIQGFCKASHNRPGCDQSLSVMLIMTELWMHQSFWKPCGSFVQQAAALAPQLRQKGPGAHRHTCCPHTRFRWHQHLFQCWASGNPQNCCASNDPFLLPWHMGAVHRGMDNSNSKLLKSKKGEGIRLWLFKWPITIHWLLL